MAAKKITPTKQERKRRAFAYAAHPLPETGFVRLPSILAVLPISRTAFLNGVKSGKYPRPIKPTPRTSMWDVASIRRVLDEMAKGC